mgnify:CR=1 FL=1
MSTPTNTTMTTTTASPRRRTGLLIAALLITALGTIAHAQAGDPEIDDVQTEDVNAPEEPKASPAIGNDEESLKVIYGDDNLFGTKLRIERHMGLYLVRYPQRDQKERISIKGKTITADVWVSIGSQTEDDLACKAVSWLVFGRTRWALGARGVFGDFPDVGRITVNFINIKKRDGQKDRVDKDALSYMTVSITRNKFNKINPDSLRDMADTMDSFLTTPFAETQRQVSKTAETRKRKRRKTGMSVQ